MKSTIIDLTSGNIVGTMLRFALPMVLGNLLQQVYNLTDTLIVGHCLGVEALAAVGASYALLVFLNSVQLGLCLGCGTVFSLLYGSRNYELLNTSRYIAFVLISVVTLLLGLSMFVGIDSLMNLMQIPLDIYMLMRSYLWVVFWGIGFTFLYNYYSSLLRAVGDSLTPLLFLFVSVILNIILDFLFIWFFHWGIEGIAWATVISQALSSVTLMIYVYFYVPELRIERQYMRFNWNILREIMAYSFLTCIQQSVMNLGILIVQGLVNSFGTIVMAAFTVAVKIDTLAYMPAQDFGNAFSTFIAQNYGAGRYDRIQKGIKTGVGITVSFCALISFLVFIFAPEFILCFVNSEETELVSVGVEYLRIEGAFYIGIGCLFLLYGFYRAVRMPGMSVVLTVISLGSRVFLAYTLAAIPSVGIIGVWWSVPIGWLLADIVGVFWLFFSKKIEYDSY